MDKTVHTVLKKLEQARDEQATNNNRFPKKEPFDHGMQIGMWLGYNDAIEILNAVLSDELEEEVRQK